MALTKSDLEQIDRKLKRHTGVLYEKFRDDIKVIAEGWKAVSEKVDATFELTGEMKEDIEIIKSDIAFIKQELRSKADREDLDALEKRVILLEKKVSRA